MSDIDTVKSITDNVETVCKAQGIIFMRETYDDIKEIPGGHFPHGQIYDEGVEFEYHHNQRSGYAEIIFLIRVVIKERDSRTRMRELQIWRHKLRDALTVNALNIGDLVSTLLVSRVTTDLVENESTSEIAQMNYTVKVRYREA